MRGRGRGKSCTKPSRRAKGGGQRTTAARGGSSLPLADSFPVPEGKGPVPTELSWQRQRAASLARGKKVIESPDLRWPAGHGGYKNDLLAIWMHFHSGPRARASLRLQLHGLTPVQR